MASRRQRRLKTLWLIAAGVGVTAIAVAAYAFGAFRSLELDSVDTRFSIRGERAPPRGIVLVKIDDVTFNELQERFPFPRSIHARVIDRLRADGARAIAYDVQFTEPTEEREDAALVEAVGRAKRVILGTSEVGDEGESNVLGGDDVVQRVGAKAANVNFGRDSDGVIRRVPRAPDGLTHFAVATAETVTGRPVPASEFDDGDAWIDYTGPPGTIRAESLSRVVTGRTKPGTFRDKVVVVGATAPTLHDVHESSTTGERLMSGPEIQANAIDTVLRGFPLHESPPWVDIALIVLLGLAAPVAGLRLRPLAGLGVAVGVGALFVVGVQVAFDNGLILPLIYPLGALVLGAVAVLAAHYAFAAIERERVREVFARFVPEQVVADVLARADDGLRLGGVERECTVLFSDVRGFTAFSERTPAARVIEILNRYLSEMGDVILDHGGTLSAYIGDGIMAVFGVPLDQPDHADRALATAREMLVRLNRFNDWLRDEEGIEDGFRIGIGLNTGIVMAGNVGSERRLEYTVIGDTVNTASRLEGMTKGSPHFVYFSDSTKSALAQEPTDLVYVDELEVRGRLGKVKLWSLANGGRPLA